MFERNLFVVAALTILGLGISPAGATWAVVLTDAETGEVGIGQATCVSGIDLRGLSAVIVSGKGVATVQAFVDSSGVSRTTIRDQLIAGTPPADILTLLDATDPDYETHQYCIADVDHGAATYTGTTAQTFDFAGGQTGQDGSIRYCVAGNLLAGQPVVNQAVQAITSTAGSLADKLMAAMEAARSMGGDGRCSCSGANPTGCGSPPASFTISSINGYLISARSGDTADCAFCSGGDYYLKLDVANRPAGVDPILVLQGQYDAFVVDQQGRPDAVRSVVSLDPSMILPDGAATADMDVQLLDIDGDPIGLMLSSFAIEHAPNSAGVSTIGAVSDNGGGNYSTTITAGGLPGVDRFRITADDGQRPVVLMPAPRLPVGTPPEVTNARWTGMSLLQWDAVPEAVAYRVYRGDLVDLDCGFAGDCRVDLDPDLTDLTLTDPAVPIPGEALFYLITSVDHEGNESTLGVSDCGARTRGVPCP